MKKLILNYSNYSNNEFINFSDFSDIKYLVKNGNINLIKEYIKFGSNFDRFYNNYKDLLIKRKIYNSELVYTKSFISYIKYLLNGFSNISISLDLKYNGYIKFLIIQKKKYYKDFNSYYKDKEYFNLFKKHRQNKKNLNYKDLFNLISKRYSRYNKLDGLYSIRKKIKENIINQLENSEYSLLNRGNNQVIIYNKNDHNKNNHITFYKNGIGIFKDSKLLKTFTYKNNINILNYIHI